MEKFHKFPYHLSEKNIQKLKIFAESLKQIFQPNQIEKNVNLELTINGE